MDVESSKCKINGSWDLFRSETLELYFCGCVFIFLCQHVFVASGADGVTRHEQHKCISHSVSVRVLDVGHSGATVSFEADKFQHHIETFSF